MANGPQLAEPFSENELLRLIDDEIAASVCFDNDVRIGDATDAGAPGDRAAALDYYRGRMWDLPAPDGWSHAVSRDVADTIDFMLPGLMRVFSGAGEIAQYQPAKHGDEPGAQQATDYINNLWDNELDGYRVLETWIMDALQVRNGIVKVYWDDTPTYDTEDMSGLSDNQLVLLMQDTEVEVIGYGERQQVITDPMSGQSMPITLHDVRVRRVVQTGHMALDNVPPEDFGVSANTRTLERARMVWHRSIMTRSDLIRDGYSREVVDDLPAYSASPDANRYRDDWMGPAAPQSPGGALDEIEVYDCYPLFDADGDGVAERVKVVVAGGRGGRQILPGRDGSLVTPWPEDDLPFVDLTPKPVPHRWMGQSVADDVMDLQRIKTALLRQMLDNLYLVNRPEREVVENQIVNPDEVLNRAVGNVIRVKTAGAIKDLVTPYIGDKALQGIQYVDSVIQRRTGVAPSSAALDATALEPQTATAEQIEHDANYARIELIARNMAELGLKKLFRKMLRIVVRHQDRPRTIRLRDTWVDMDPRAWNAAMDVTVNVGLGTGSRERDLAMLRGVAAQQDMVVQQLGPNNPIVPPSKWIATRQKMVQAAGLREPDQYFSPVNDEQFGQWQQSQQQAAQPDPRAQQEQQRTALTAQKAQAQLQITAQGQQANAMTKAAETQQRMAMREAELAHKAEMDQRKQDHDFALGLRELELEAMIKAREIEEGINSNANLRQVQ